ncbi:MAG: peptidase C10 [Polaribacter sp.]|nr:MAG: peptidase C10 [Polaribacter sp.]
MRRINQILLIVFSMLLFACSVDKPVDNSVAKEPNNTESTFLTQREASVIAEKFINAQGLLGPETKASDTDLNMVYTDLTDEVSTKSGKKPAYYIFNIGQKGYIIVSASKVTTPVLGYSFESTFDAKDIPINMKGVLVGYKAEINYAREKGLKVTEETKQLTEALLNGEEVKTKGRSYARRVAPLLGNIKWNQQPYYNAYCPGNCPVGCVATATSMIMRYYKYPSSGVGTYSYYSSYAGKYLNFNYNYNLDWNAMPEGALTGPNYTVAKFCYGVAVGIKMQFSPGGSGAWQWDVIPLLKNHYRYPNTLRALHRKNYNANSWANIVLKEILAGRPVQYAGQGSGGGHSFVCDGYWGDGYFHFNWGWGGKSDGYFKLNALNPGSLGTGGGTGGFNSYQNIIVGFAPPAGRGGDDDNNNGGGNDNGGNDDDDNGGNDDGGNDDGDDNGGDDNGDNDDNDDGDVNYDYCKPKPVTSFYAYIEGVRFGNIHNHSRGNRYADYTRYSSTTTYAKAGQKVYVRFVPGFYRRSYQMYWKVWMDYNNDKTFSDSSERLVAFKGSRAGSGYIKIPSNLQKGKYRLRVAMKYGSYPSPCESFKYGEVEDYTVVIE